MTTSRGLMVLFWQPNRLILISFLVFGTKINILFLIIIYWIAKSLCVPVAMCQLLKWPNDATCIWNVNRMHSHSHSKWWFISVHCFIATKWKQSETEKQKEKEINKTIICIHHLEAHLELKYLLVNVNAAGRTFSAGWKQVKTELYYTKIDWAFNRTSGE